ncbi:hypothetical protein HanRHA438_Chr03g0132951 [Helianthus annuus]|nr:hypothetical protein HanOQP8_Chr03g0113471 [Helianthus annuus]KAJ0936593.1 hypothetical protein HanRHA438_Chr03g0132951 [Helianthus annuus]
MIVREGDKVCAFRCRLVDTIATHLRERWSANQNANKKKSLLGNSKDTSEDDSVSEIKHFIESSVASS